MPFTTCQASVCGIYCTLCLDEKALPVYHALYDMSGAVLVEGNLELIYAFNEVAPDPGNIPKFLHELMNPKSPTFIEQTLQRIRAFLSWP